MIFVAAGTLLAFIYFVLQAYYLFHWQRTKPIHVPNEFKPEISLSVVVVAHNEEAHIEETITSILQQSFPQDHFEVIIVDDRSVDHTAEIARRFESQKLRVVRLADFPSFVHSPAFKKSGIELGVHLAEFDFIVVTDADCIHHKDWLQTIAYTLQSTGASFTTGPLLMKDANTFVEKLQQIEGLGLLLATAGGIQSGLHTIANGANMSFSKQAFKDVSGYEGNYNYASGDDMFLAEKMKQYDPDNILFLKSTGGAVYTSPKSNWSALIKQRIRWAGKNKGLKDHNIHSIWMLIGGYHLAMIAMLLSGIMNPYALISFCILFFTKIIIDYFSLHTIAGFFRIKIRLFDFLILQGVYTYYILFLAFHLLTGKRGDWK